MVRRRGLVGRPTLPPDAARGLRVNLRLNPDEFAKIAAIAANVGLTPTAYLRRAGLGTVPPPPTVVPEVNIEKWGELGRALSNVNQLVRELHQDRVRVIGPEILPLLRTIRDELHATREALRGRKVGKPDRQQHTASSRPDGVHR